MKTKGYHVLIINYPLLDRIVTQITKTHSLCAFLPLEALIRTTNYTYFLFAFYTVYIE